MGDNPRTGLCQTIGNGGANVAARPGHENGVFTQVKQRIDGLHISLCGGVHYARHRTWCCVVGEGLAEIAGVYRPQGATPFYTEERCHILEMLNTSACPAVSLAECRVAPGVTTQLHRLRVAERYVIQQGQGRMELHGDTMREQVDEVQPGDCVMIPAGCAQRIKNTGTEDLVFLCVCTPRFEPVHYETLESPTTKDIAERD